MTEAEKRLIDAALEMMADNPDVTRGELAEAVRAVNFERMPAEFSSTLRDLCFRAYSALDAANKYAGKHPFGDELRRKFREEYERGAGS